MLSLVGTYINGYLKLDKEYTESLFEQINNLEFENIHAILKYSFNRDKHRIPKKRQ
jgi:hypothetical protein